LNLKVIQFETIKQCFGYRNRNKFCSYVIESQRNPCQLLLLDHVLGAVDGLMGDVNEPIVPIFEEFRKVESNREEDHHADADYKHFFRHGLK